MNGKLDHSMMTLEHAIRGLPYLLFKIEGNVQSQLRTLPATTRPALGLEALIAFHVGADLRFASWSRIWGPIPTVSKTFHVWFSVSLRARSPTRIAGNGFWLAERHDSGWLALSGLSCLNSIGQEVL